jgi:hypothetical protein
LPLPSHNVATMIGIGAEEVRTVCPSLYNVDANRSEQDVTAVVIEATAQVVYSENSLETLEI